jgi:hypothetical protein
MRKAEKLFTTLFALPSFIYSDDKARKVILIALTIFNTSKKRMEEMQQLKRAIYCLSEQNREWKLF